MSLIHSPLCGGWIFLNDEGLQECLLCARVLNAPEPLSIPPGQILNAPNHPGDVVGKRGQARGASYGVSAGRLV